MPRYAKICQDKVKIKKGKKARKARKYREYGKNQDFIHLPRQHLSFDDGGVGDDLPREGGAFGGQDIC